MTIRDTPIVSGDSDGFSLECNGRASAEPLLQHGTQLSNSVESGCSNVPDTVPTISVGARQRPGLRPLSTKAPRMPKYETGRPDTPARRLVVSSGPPGSKPPPFRPAARKCTVPGPFSLDPLQNVPPGSPTCRATRTARLLIPPVSGRLGNKVFRAGEALGRSGVWAWWADPLYHPGNPENPDRGLHIRPSPGRF